MATHGSSSGNVSGPRKINPNSILFLFLTLHLPSIAMGLGMGVAGPVLPKLAQTFGANASGASAVFVSHMLGTVAATVPIGFVVDRFGRRKVLLAGPIIVAASSFMVAFAGSYAELLVYRFIAGFGQQMWMMSRLTVIADTGAQRQRGRQITSMFGIQQVGNMAGPALGGFTAAAWGAGVPFMIAAAVALLSLIPSFFLVRETQTRSRAQGGGATQPEQNFSWKSLLVHPIPAVFSVQFLANVTRGGVFGGGVLFVYGTFAYDASEATLGALASVMAVVGIPITFTAGYIMDRFGRKMTIVPGLLLVGTAMLYMASTAYYALPFMAYAIGFVAVHLATSLISGNMQTLGSDIAPAHARGRFFGVSRLMGQGGSTVSPTAFAVLSASSGFAAPFVFFSVTALMGATIMMAFVKETLQRTPKASPSPTA